MSQTCTHLDQIELTELPDAIPSAEPGEDWSWCYVDQVAYVIGAPDAA